MALSLKLAKALEAAAAPLRPFTCPLTKLSLSLRLLSVSERSLANARATEEWGDRALISRFDEEDYSRLMIMHALAAAVSHEGEPVGLEFIRRLNERTVTRYAGEYSALEDEFDPPIETWSEAELEAFVEGLKKKEPASMALLRTFDGATLIGLLLTTVGLLASSETSRSSPPPSSTPTDPETER